MSNRRRSWIIGMFILITAITRLSHGRASSAQSQAQRERIILADAAKLREPTSPKVPGEVSKVIFSPDGITLTDMSFSPDGKTILSGSDDPAAKLWDAASGPLLHTLAGHTDSINIHIRRSQPISPGGALLYIPSLSNTLAPWPVADRFHTNLVIARAPEPATAAPFHQPTLQSKPPIISSKNAARLRPFKHIPARNDTTHVAIGGQTLAYCNRTAIFFVDLTDAQSEHRQLTINGNCRIFALTRDGSTLAVAASNPNHVELWDTQTLTMSFTLTHPSIVFSGAFSPDGQSLAVGTYDATIWNVKTGLALLTLKGNQTNIAGLAWTPTGKTLVAGGGSDDHTLRFWTIAKPQNKPAVIQIDTVSIINSLTYSANGKLAVHSGHSHSVFLFDPVRPKNLIEFNYAATALNSVALSLDGSLIASSTILGDLILWNSSSPTRKPRIIQHKPILHGLSMSPDGTLLASIDQDGIQLWAVPAT